MDKESLKKNQFWYLIGGYGVIVLILTICALVSGSAEAAKKRDDLAKFKKTVAELKARGVEFVDGIKDEGFGLVTHFRVPGDFAVMLYQPRYSKGRKA